MEAQEGNWLEAWKHNEWRLHGRCTHPHWQGESLEGRSLLVCLDAVASGAGDVLQYARFLPLLKARGAKRIDIEVPSPPGLKHPLARSLPVDAVVGEGGGMGPYDYYTHYLSLPLLCAPTPELWPQPPSLRPDVKKVEAWRRRLQAFRGVRIGVVWRCQPGNWNSAQRSCELWHLFPLTEIAGLKLFSLLKDATNEEKATLQQLGVVDLSPTLDSWDTTAAAMNNLDLVVSVDSWPLHLAGALGRPAFALLPTPSDWRYGLADVTPWYPTMRLFRQPQHGDWTGAVARAADGLALLSL